MNIKVHRKGNLAKLIFVGQFTLDESVHNYQRRRNPVAWFQDNLGPCSTKRVDGRELGDDWWTYKIEGHRLTIRMKDCAALSQYLLIHSS